MNEFNELSNKIKNIIADIILLKKSINKIWKKINEKESIQEKVYSTINNGFDTCETYTRMNEDNKVYVVTKGEYSDYSICAIFNDKTLAKKYINGYTHYNEIEEYEINPKFKNLIKYTLYEVVMNKKGEVREISNYTTERIENMDEEDFEYIIFDHPIYKEKVISLICDAKDNSHAVKIINEKRIQSIAKEEW